MELSERCFGSSSKLPLTDNRCGDRVGAVSDDAHVG